ncbi:SoxR reducing system RseC family protein [Halomonas sp. SpR8]|uniref:SoxR reducing system RseC family protein n=1 Tax=Halomonas sp. SpR8 TaxID=3050463 RepID=UPI0027E5A3B5|nr:SoxR reducing system RseC family protein [Halomonas sp. SpR8]MDQ7727546.1 SoxR reducing system RseC family protein [Halomonas sp. SpR8]
MTPATCASLLNTPLLRMGTIVDYYPIGCTPRGLIVEISAQRGCEQCAQGRGCGVGLLARQRSQRIAVALPSSEPSAAQNYPLGHPVTISLPRASVTLLAFLVYGLPLMLALLLSGLVSFISTTAWLEPLVFFTVLAGGALSIKCLMRGRGERFRPRLVN